MTATEEAIRQVNVLRTDWLHVVACLRPLSEEDVVAGLRPLSEKWEGSDKARVDNLIDIFDWATDLLAALDDSLRGSAGKQDTLGILEAAYNRAWAKLGQRGLCTKLRFIRGSIASIPQ